MWPTCQGRHFIAQAPALDLVGLGDAVLAAQGRSFAALFQVAVFDEVGGSSAGRAEARVPGEL